MRRLADSMPPDGSERTQIFTSMVETFSREHMCLVSFRAFAESLLCLCGCPRFFSGGYTNGPSYLSNVWRYTRHTRQWTLLITGQPNIDPMYNTRGVYSVGTSPGGRCRMDAAVDDSGNVWTGFGLTASTNPSDLFMYNTNGSWIFQAGVNVQAYPSSDIWPKDVPFSGANQGPGSRRLANLSVQKVVLVVLGHVQLAIKCSYVDCVLLLNWGAASGATRNCGSSAVSCSRRTTTSG
jgi:hypothetical protein